MVWDYGKKEYLNKLYLDVLIWLIVVFDKFGEIELLAKMFTRIKAE